jgi:hypothetical protein
MILIEIPLNGGVGCCTHRREHKCDLIALDKLTGLFKGFWRRKTVVAAQHRELAPVHTALLIDHREVSSDHLTHGAERRGRSAAGHSVTDLDLSVRHTGPIFLLRGDGVRKKNKAQEDAY